jgi:hypothetical protein
MTYVFTHAVPPSGAMIKPDLSPGRRSKVLDGLAGPFALGRGYSSVCGLLGAFGKRCSTPRSWA